MATRVTKLKFFSIDASPANWALHKAVLSETGRCRLAARGWVFVSTISCVPSAGQQLANLIIKMAAATYITTLGQIPALKKRSWSKLESYNLISENLSKSWVNVALHAYKFVMFLTISPICCLITGIVSPKTCKDIHDKLHLTGPQQAQVGLNESPSDPTSLPSSQAVESLPAAKKAALSTDTQSRPLPAIPSNGVPPPPPLPPNSFINPSNIEEEKDVEDLLDLILAMKLKSVTPQEAEEHSEAENDILLQTFGSAFNQMANKLSNEPGSTNSSARNSVNLDEWRDSPSHSARNSTMYAQEPLLIGIEREKLVEEELVQRLEAVKNDDEHVESQVQLPAQGDIKKEAQTLEDKREKDNEQEKTLSMEDIHQKIKRRRRALETFNTLTAAQQSLIRTKLNPNQKNILNKLVELPPEPKAEPQHGSTANKSAKVAAETNNSAASKSNKRRRRRNAARKNVKPS
ncbi:MULTISPECIES: hypothetical protein [unclassified Neochlamydia]|uniref:hypothetical protein n=1 Tax=unclassified Neochlamydia TaxID=2643326 RepID=UPI001BC8EBFD|nr:MULTISPECIES: hypothetical protein [unclassified Neochlamydia]MBS4166532.1 Uncharacterized protein [Neochlamydia sp. AcF65]MBS4170043.1 Uncharacterized protein [Neochlamydia sp. AcF95]